MDVLVTFVRVNARGKEQDGDTEEEPRTLHVVSLKADRLPAEWSKRKLHTHSKDGLTDCKPRAYTVGTRGIGGS